MTMVRFPTPNSADVAFWTTYSRSPTLILLVQQVKAHRVGPVWNAKDTDVELNPGFGPKVNPCLSVKGRLLTQD